MFGSIYLCEAAISTLVIQKQFERDLRCALSGIKSRIKQLVAKKHFQVSY